MTFGGSEILLTLKIAAALLQIGHAVADYRREQPRPICVLCSAPMPAPDAQQRAWDKATGQGF